MRPPCFHHPRLALALLLFSLSAGAKGPAKAAPKKDPLAEAQKFMSDKDTAQALTALEKLVSKNPKKVEYRYELGKLCFEIGDSKSAMKHLNAALPYLNQAAAKSPADPEILRLRGIVLTRDKKKASQARKDLETALSLDTSQAGLKKAALALSRAVGFFPADGILHLAWARVLDRQKQWAPAVEQYSLAKVKGPEGAGIEARVGTLYLKLNNKDSAEVRWQKSLEINPLQAEIALGLGKLLEERKDYANAAGYYDLAVEAGAAPNEARFRAGRCFFSLSEYATAKQRLLPAVKADPKNAEALKMLGQIFSLEKNAKAALGYFSRAHQMKPGDTLLIRLFAATAREAGDNASAAAAYPKYLKLNPGDFQARADLGRAYLALKRLPQALEEFDKVAEGDFKIIESEFDVARAYFKANRTKPAKPILLGVLRIYPENAEAQEMAAVILEKENNFSEAALHYADAVKADPRRTALLKKAGDLYFKAGKVPDAVEAYEAALKATRDPAVAAILLKHFQKEGKDEDTRRMLLLLSGGKESGVENLIALGKLDYEKGNPRQALASFSRVLKAKPLHTEALLFAGRIHLELKDVKQALPLLTRAAAADPASSEAALNLARAFGLADNRDKEALSYRKVLQLDPKNREALDKLLAFNRKPGRGDALIALLLQKTKLDSGEAPAFLELGRLYLKAGKKIEAEAAFKRAAGLENDEALAEWAKLCAAQGRWGEAVEHYKKSVFIKSDHPGRFYELGKACLALKDSLPAVEAFEKTVELNPDHAEALRTLSALYLALRYQEKAVALLKKNLAEKPGQAQAHLEISKLYLEAKDFAQAGPYLEKALRLSPDNAEAQALWGDLLSRQGKFREAAAYYAKARRKNPKSPEMALRHAGALHADGSEKAALAILQKLPPLTPVLALLMECHLSLGEIKIAAGYMARLEKADSTKIGKSVKVARAYSALGKKDRALAILESMEKSDDPDYYRLLGDLTRAKGQNDRALEAYRNLFSRNKADLKTGLLLASLYEEQGDDGAAENVYQDLERSFPREAAVQERFLALYKRGGPKSAGNLGAVIGRLVKLNPDDAFYQFAQAEWEYAQGKTDAARRGLEKLLERQPGHLQANALLGAILADQKLFQEALKYLGLAARSLKSDTALFKRLGRACLETKRFAQAAAALEQARRLDPKDMETANGLALAYRALNKTAPLQELYAKILESDPRNFPARRGLGDFHYAQKDEEKAMQEYRAALSVQSDDPALLKRQAELLYKKGAFPEAAGLLETLLNLDSSQAEPHYRLALIQWNHLGKTEDAQAHLKKTVTLLPSHFKARQALSEIYLEQGDVPNAAAELERALKLKPSDPGLLKTYAELLVKQGKSAKAVPILTRAIAANPGDPGLKTTLGKTYFALGNYKQAAALLAAARAAKPKDVELTLTLVSAYNKLNLPAKAIPLLTHMMESGFATTDVKLQLGIAYFHLGDWVRAQSLLEGVLSQTQGSAEAINTLGDVYVAQGNPKKARMVYRQLLNLDPGNPGANIRLGDIAMSEFDYAQAQQYFKTAFEKDPAYPGLAGKIAESHLAMGDVHSARTFLVEALNKNPADANLNLHFGKILYREGNFAEAELRLVKVFKSKDAEEAVFYYILCLSKSGRGEEAVSYAKSVMARLGNTPRLTIALAAAYTALGEPDYALMHLQQAEKLDASNAEIFRIRAEVYLYDKANPNSARANFQRYLFLKGDSSQVPPEYR